MQTSNRFSFVFFCECLFITSTVFTANDWTDVILVREGTPVTLPCSDKKPMDGDQVKWMMMPASDKQWTMVFSVNISVEMANRSWKKLRQQGGRTLELFDDLSLGLSATMEDGGRYSCLTQLGDGKLKERIVVLALVKLTLAPAPTIHRDSIVRLKAEVSPSYAVASGTWLSPTGVTLLTEITSVGILLAKLPRVTRQDVGVYTCSITVNGPSNKPTYNYTLTVMLNDKEVAPSPNIVYDTMCNVPALNLSPVSLCCPPIDGDYMRVYWWHPDDFRNQPDLIFQFDRWRNSSKQDTPRLELVGSSVHSRNFSLLLKPKLKDGGRYQCEVFLDDKVFGQVTRLSVLQGYSSSSKSSMTLHCAYNERGQVASLKWLHLQRPEHSLHWFGVLGRISVTIDLPITPETAGQYACILQLVNSQTVQYLHNVTMTPTGSVSGTERPCCGTEEFTTDSLTPASDGDTAPKPFIPLSSFSLLLFLVPVAAAPVGVLLWRRGPCTSSRNVQRTLSHYSGEVENIYENPEDLRQSPPGSTVYMDLKPRGDTDVYRELDRYDQCCG